MEILKRLGIVVAVFAAIAGSLWLASWWFESQALAPRQVLSDYLFLVLAAAFWAVVYLAKDIVRERVVASAHLNVGNQPVEKEVENEHDENVGKAYDGVLSGLLGWFVALVAANYFTATLWPVNVVWLVIMIPAVAIGYTQWSVMIRHLADIGAWVVRIPENHAAVIEKDGAVWRIVINVTDQARRDHFQSLVAKYGEIIHVLPLGDGLYFYGWAKWPWIYRLHKPWYESRDDAADPGKKPEKFLALNMREWKFNRQAGGKGSVPAVQTLDPIDVVADLFMTATIWDPYKALYNRAEELFGDAVLQTLIADFRAVIAALSYYNKDGESVVVNPAIQKDVEGKLRAKLGLPNGTDPLTLAFKCLDAYGYQVHDVKVTDLDPLDPRDLEIIKGVSRAQAEAQRRKIEADGEGNAIERLARAEAKALGLVREETDKPGGREVLNARTATNVSSNVGSLVVLGGGQCGDLTNAVGALIGTGGSISATTGNSGKKPEKPADPAPEPAKTGGEKPPSKDKPAAPAGKSGG